ncbi:tRNA (adenosine(37)-N6)-threonylcarbamoyltransferase complex transferase subunit TsaD [Legionella anisa]|uniref:tRNA N6-adenosine threonylcarbamoyltransferase n=1 Tax=Legionella anisa TaxID=28082 RepID=A0AAX0WWV9_9GAMM|nr:tRNA (adenosine(37)-N6)-threonylcarbamoyltransferase complex transferase subunit TsaD [Legionella anisa]AWN73279.1 tRNA (adenosine(37)-N6)-threonylcarbamoyltransferase complex transferase subunit TsaD [Legionella anisa]KTC69909.1 O-sialoglycoprotein endopeptidase [Legionella anisa]MCW8423058.1 tRNA (adenosine(37)-N6)-threonylcarbamoyltransferase complex transferase subunit TsaD [Legionella anisa]MCW8447799.1 tRNA (adenosine(37)-N6)-threonylcarbamoyltransferase complex transferase subunit Tsa
MLILGIESSCDETGIAIYDSDAGLLAHALHSQIDTHRVHGGVVPELASRDHINYLIPLLDKVLQQTGIDKKALDGIAYTAGPGLIGALLVGACFAKSVACALQIPSLAIHHLEAHLLAAKMETPSLEFPFIALLVSGGHCQLVEVKDLGTYCILGDTLDDAVGEAFDKTAKLMGIPYPGGPVLAALADQCESTPYRFPRPMTDRPGLDFSFSGLKTFALNTWSQSTKDERARAEIAKAFQEAVVETLMIKCKRAVQESGCKQLVVAGGVGANKALRSGLREWIQSIGGTIYFPALEYCTDNGAMIAYAGCLRMLRGEKDVSSGVEVKARWPLA